MSELHDRYDRGAVADRIIQPPFAELAGRARRRAHRHRTVRLAGVATLAALVAAPLLTLPGGGGKDPAQFPDVEFPDDFYGTGGVSFSMEFYDPRHGYATYTGVSCDTAWLSVTRDGGATWSDLREVPGTRKYPASEDGLPGDWVCASPRVIPVSTETLIVLVGADTRTGYEWVEPPTTAYISHDAGERWREYQPQVRTVDTVPDGVIVGRHCEDDVCDEAGLGWHDPETGDRLVLRDTPAVMPTASRRPTTAADGSIWVAESDPDLGFRLMVSRDRGRSWQDRTPDQLGTIHVGSTAFTTSDGETAYLWASPSGLHRTVDGGETWQELPAGQPFASMETMRVAQDGTLVVGELQEGTQYVSGDGGETFRATDQPLWDVRQLVDGWYGFYPDDSVDNPIDGYVSEDGLTWQPIRAPHP